MLKIPYCPVDVKNFKIMKNEIDFQWKAEYHRGIKTKIETICFSSRNC